MNDCQIKSPFLSLNKIYLHFISNIFKIYLSNYYLTLHVICQKKKKRMVPFHGSLESQDDQSDCKAVGFLSESSFRSGFLELV